FFTRSPTTQISPLSLHDALPIYFAVNPNYRLGYVQIWNVDLQREFPGGVVMNAGYNGAKGTRLDTERALVVSGGQPFIYESSEGDRKSTRLNSSHVSISYAVFCL